MNAVKNVIGKFFGKRMQVFFRDLEPGDCFFVGKKKLYKAKRRSSNGQPFNCYEKIYKTKTKCYYFCRAGDVVEVKQINEVKE